MFLGLNDNYQFPINKFFIYLFIYLFIDKTYLQKPHCITTEKISSNKT